MSETCRVDLNITLKNTATDKIKKKIYKELDEAWIPYEEFSEGSIYCSQERNFANWGLSEVQNFCFSKEVSKHIEEAILTIRYIERAPTEEKNILYEQDEDDIKEEKVKKKSVLKKDKPWVK
jgi:hypothetical protein